MFLTEEKVLKRIEQDRQRGDLKKAHQRALDAVERWPGNYDLEMEAARACFDLSDYHKAVSLLKNALRSTPRNRAEIMNFAHQTLMDSFNPFLGSFLVEAYLRSRDIDRVEQILGSSPESFIDDLIKRSETRAKNSSPGGQADKSGVADTELLLGLLYLHKRLFAEALSPLGAALERSPEDVQVIGSKFIELDRVLPASAGVKYYLGLSSSLLSHPEKMEARFFQSLELDDPPLEKILQAIELTDKQSEHLPLLRGEVLVRMHRFGEGATIIREYLSSNEGAWTTGRPGDEIKHLFPDRVDKKELVFNRLSMLADAFGKSRDVIFLICDATVLAGRPGEAVEPLERLFTADPGSAVDIISWLEGSTEILSTAPAQRLVTKLHLAGADYEKAAQAAHLASEMNSSFIPGIIETVKETIASIDDPAPALKAMLAELYAQAGNAELAEEILLELTTEGCAEDDKLFELTGEIMKHCGVTLDGVVAAVQKGFECGKITDTVPFALEFYRREPGERKRFAERIAALAGENADLWESVSALLDGMAGEETLKNHFRTLQARAHLENGAIERAVFEFDQLLMFDAGLRGELIEIYENAVRRHSDNMMLNLALYQLRLEEEQFAEAAHYLCRTLVLDPGQIRDVMDRFDALIAREPENETIWEEMLKTALEMDHPDCAKDILGRAVERLPQEKSAGLHIYGAMISDLEGNTEDTLRCLAIALTSSTPDMQAIEGTLGDIVSREPHNPEALYLMGETLMRLRREDEAVGAFEKCLGISHAYEPRITQRLEEMLPQSIQTWAISRMLGMIEWSKGMLEDAFRYLSTAQKGPKESLHALARTLEELMRRAPDNSQLTSLYAQTLSRRGEYDRAVKISEELAARDGNMSKPAIEILMKLLEEEPSHRAANHLLARLLIEIGEPERSLEPVLNILQDESSNKNDLDVIAEEFFFFHKDNTDFLINFARIKAGKGDFKKALLHYREILSAEPDSWQRVTRDVEAIEWPESYGGARRLLLADCCLAGQQDIDAFALLREFETAECGLADETMQRLDLLIERHPLKEHFSFGCYLLASAGKSGRAEELIERGCALLEDGEALDLRIELGETLQCMDLPERAAAIFSAALEDAADRTTILKHMEHASHLWNERQLARGLERRAHEEIPAQESAKLVNIALDLERPEAALELLSDCTCSDILRKQLLAETYISMERPFAALAVLGALETGGCGDAACEMLYLKGVASEMAGDYGRAACAFSKIVEINGEYRDSRGRAERNHARFVGSQLEVTALTLEKTADLQAAHAEGEDEQ